MLLLPEVDHLISQKLILYNANRLRLWLAKGVISYCYGCNGSEAETKATKQMLLPCCRHATSPGSPSHINSGSLMPANYVKYPRNLIFPLIYHLPLCTGFTLRKRSMSCSCAVVCTRCSGKVQCVGLLCFGNCQSRKMP